MFSASKNFDPLTGKIVPVFLYYAVPEIIGILAVSSASLVDAAFLGQFVGASALAAVNLSVPVYSLIYGLGMLFGVGGSVVCGKFLGEKSSETANQIFSSTIIVNLGLGFLLLGLGWLFIDGLVASLGATDEALAELLKTYLGILLWFTPFIMAEMVFFYFVRLDGNPALAAIALSAGAAVNVALDYWLIAHLGLGIKGAAYATGIAAAIVCLVLLPHFLLGKSKMTFGPPLRDYWFLLKAYANGMSEFASEASVGVTTFIFNWVLITRMGVEGVAALTIIDAVLLIGLIASYGVCDSLQPLISQNFGAKRADRIVQFLRVAGAGLGAISIVMILSMLFIPEYLIGIFLKPEEAKAAQIATDFIAVLWPVFLFAGFNMLFSGYLTSMQKPMESAFLSFSRSFAMPAAFLLLLPIWLNDLGIYLALPMAEAFTFIVAVLLFLKHQPRNLISQEPH